MGISGIYQIQNRVNGKRYVGSAIDVRKRWREHLSGLRNGQHYNRHLQRAFDKYGEDVFTFGILKQVADFAQLIPHEQHFLDTLCPEYNICPTAGSQLGYQHTKETLRKMTGKRNHMYGKHHSVEHCRKMRAAFSGERSVLYGKHPSDETRARMREAHKGKHLSEETRAKMSKAQMGHQVSEETRSKLSQAHKGKRLTVEHRKKISVALTGRQLSAEHRRKMSLAMRGERNPNYGKYGQLHPSYGRHHSEETKRKMSEAGKAYWRRVHISESRKRGE